MSKQRMKLQITEKVLLYCTLAVWLSWWAWLIKVVVTKVFLTHETLQHQHSLLSTSLLHSNFGCITCYFIPSKRKRVNYWIAISSFWLEFHWQSCSSKLSTANWWRAMPVIHAIFYVHDIMVYYWNLELADLTDAHSDFYLFLCVCVS